MTTFAGKLVRPPWGNHGYAKIWAKEFHRWNSLSISHLARCAEWLERLWVPFFCGISILDPSIPCPTGHRVWSCKQPNSYYYLSSHQCNVTCKLLWSMKSPVTAQGSLGVSPNSRTSFSEKIVRVTMSCYHMIISLFLLAEDCQLTTSRPDQTWSLQITY